MRPLLLAAALVPAAPAMAQDMSAGGAGVTRQMLRHEMGGMAQWMVLADRAEVQGRDGRDAFIWDGTAWYGGDINRLWLETEGETGLSGGGTAAEAELLYGRAISSFFDIQAGARYDFAPGGRTSAEIGIQGLAPYWFEVDAEAYLDTAGDLTASFEAEYDLLITQRLILQPRLEAEFAAQDVADLGLGAGVTDISLGARLRYEIRREFAPYIGVEWARAVGETAGLARAAGQDPGGVSALAGIRVWF